MPSRICCPDDHSTKGDFDSRGRRRPFPKGENSVSARDAASRSSTGLTTPMLTTRAQSDIVSSSRKRFGSERGWRTAKITTRSY